MAYAEEARSRRTFINHYFPHASSRRGDRFIKPGDEQVLRSLETYKSKNKWPIERDRAKIFAAKPELTMVRLSKKSNVIHHEKEMIQKTNRCKSGKKTCAMCSNTAAQRHVRQMCTLCLVPLCTKVHEGFETSCWEAWHTVPDLATEIKKRQDTFVAKLNAAKSRNVAGKHAREEDNALSAAAVAIAHNDEDDNFSLPSIPSPSKRRNAD